MQAGTELMLAVTKADTAGTRARLLVSLRNGTGQFRVSWAFVLYGEGPSLFPVGRRMLPRAL